MFKDQGNEGHEHIVKAQALFRRLVDCGPDGTFRKVFGEAIQQHTLDEFYPVVVRAELSAALMLCHAAAARVHGFSFHDYLQACCGLRPAQLISLPLQDVADISETPVHEIEEILRAFGYTVQDGAVSDHPDAHRKDGREQEIVDLAEKRKVRHAG